MRITVDCRHYNASGIGVYVRECLRYFLQTEHHFILLGDRRQLQPLAAPNVCIADCAVAPFSLRELFAFPPALLKLINGGDCYWSPYINLPGGITVPVYTTIHDVIFFDVPGIVSPLGLWARRFFFVRATRTSKTIFTVSRFSEERIKARFGKTLHVLVTYSAIKPALAGWRGPYPAKTRTILFIGNLKKHKGLSLLIEAFTAAWREGLDYTLRVAGSAQQLRSADNGARSGIADGAPVEWLDTLDDEQLRALLSEAALLVQPSLYEGFGLPPLEALTLGTAALIADIPVFREIYGEFPVSWFTAGDSASLKDKLFELLYTADRREPRPIPRPVLAPELRGRYTFEKTSGVIMEELCRTQR